MDVQSGFFLPGSEDGSAAVTGGFIRETEELNAQIFPTRSAVEQSYNHACLVQVRRK